MYPQRLNNVVKYTGYSNNITRNMGFAVYLFCSNVSNFGKSMNDVAYNLGLRFAYPAPDRTLSVLLGGQATDSGLCVSRFLILTGLKGVRTWRTRRH